MAKGNSPAAQGFKWSGELFRTVLDWAEQCRQEIAALREGDVDANDEAAPDDAELENQQYDRLLQTLRENAGDDEYKPESRADIEELLDKVSARLVELSPNRHDLREHGMMVIDPKELPKYARDRFSKQELDQWRVRKKNYRRKRERVRKPQNQGRTQNPRPQHDSSKPTLDAELQKLLSEKIDSEHGV